MTARSVKKAKTQTDKNPLRVQLRTLSRALRDVHRALVEFSRDRYELENGPIEGKAQLLDLLLRDDAFAWLRPMSRLIVTIDQLAGRRPVPSEDEVAAIRARVEAFIEPGAPNSFGSRYCGLLPSEPDVTKHHGVLREAIRDLPEATAA
ncbi:MAG: hypothetical protein ACRDJ1_01940 [Actinomycetota bacterium]